MPDQIPEIERVMAVMAHPDDMEFTCGGSLARMTAQGVEATLVVCTRGNRGGEGDRTEAELERVRESEQRAACEVLGVQNLEILGHDDGYLTPSLELRADITRMIRKHRPNLVICPNPVRHFGFIYGNHPDHLAVGEAAMAAVYPTARNPMAVPELGREGLEKWVVDWVWVGGTMPEDVDHFVDVTAQMEAKLKALMAHQSQLGPQVQEWIKARSSQVAGEAREKGWEGMGEYAESFKQMYTGEIRRPQAAAATAEGA